ncbi:MAG: hypothetical protein ABIQ53_06790 [Terracoccus sp.]
MNTRERFSHHPTLAAVVATGVLGIGVLATAPAVAAPVTPVRATAVVATATSSSVSSTGATTAVVPALPVLTHAVKHATTRVARLGSCSAAMMDL